jgi:hypothetical protein
MIHELASDKILPELTAKYRRVDFLLDTHEYDGVSVLKCGAGFLVILLDCFFIVFFYYSFD